MSRLEKPFPSERQSAVVIRQQAEALRSVPELVNILDAVPTTLIILNAHRQVVYANKACLALLGISSVEEAYGWRLGELLQCDHASMDCGGGCGTTEACRACGAALAIYAVERGAASVQECRVRRSAAHALDLRVSSTPFNYRGERFTVLGLTDIGHEKRRQALERVFFHDLLNTAGSIMGYAELLRQARAFEIDEFSAALQRLVEQLAEEIRSQRDLVLAENDDLSISWEPLDSGIILQDVVQSCSRLEAAQARSIELDAAAANVSLTSDSRLLHRVLSNMVKNALEASEAGERVRLGCQANGSDVEFWVHNRAYIPPHVQSQIFHRSFSTKGNGRGLGTYSMKLLTERYLRGKVGFTSSLEEGTIFRASYPRVPPLAAAQG